jgi:hypothetical protein
MNEQNEQTQSEGEAPAIEAPAAPAPKAPRKPRAKKEVAPAKAEKPAKTPKVATPKPELYGFRSGWTGPSDVTNKNISRTPVDGGRFNSVPNGTVTQRDQDAMVALRKQFGGKSFERKNCDAGILRRLIERGLARHMGGDGVSLTSTYSLTLAGQGKAKPKAQKKAA